MPRKRREEPEPEPEELEDPEDDFTEEELEHLYELLDSFPELEDYDFDFGQYDDEDFYTTSEG